MKNFYFPKSYILLFVFFICSIAFFVLGQNVGNNPPSALNYAPNFQFDPDEKYYPTDPLDFYFVNGEEIEGSEAKAKYDDLSFPDKINNIVIFYHIEDEGDHWVYQYWTFFVFNNNPVTAKNKHYSDWEAVFVSVDKETKEVIRTVGTAHYRKIFDTEIESPKTNHIWAYVANGSHAICVDEENDEVCDFNKWGVLEKWGQNGHVSLYTRYKLKEITQEYISQFNGATTLTKSPILGINLINWLGFWESEEIEASESIFVIKLGGGTSKYPWEQSMYYNPEETRPRNTGYVVEIVGNFWDGLFGGENGLTFQSAGIGGALVSNTVVEEVKNIEVIERVEVIKEIKEVEVIKEVKEVKKVEKIEKIEKIEEIIIVEEEKIEVEVEEIVPSPYPFGFSFPIGGGVSGAAPVAGAAPVSVPVVSITSHASGDILGFNQINLAGTSSPGFLVSVSLASTTAATTTADNNGHWDCVLDLSEGENNLAVKAIDANNNESEDVLLNLIVDTTPPSVVSDLSATSGVARGTVVLSWTAPSDSIAVSEYIIRYATSSAITALNWASSTDIVGEPSPSSASSTENLTISNLTPSKTYYWAIKSEDDMGNLSGISNCASTSPSAIAENVVISEISVQGGVGLANDEFIELYNPTSQPVDLSNWSIQYRGGGALNFYKKDFVSENSIPKNGYFLIAHSDYNGYITADMSHAFFGLSRDGGTVFLVNDQIDLTSATSTSIIDKISYGSGNYLFPEKTEFASVPSSEQSLERQAFTTSTAELLAVNNSHHWKGNNIDRNDNSQDFVLQTVPNPQNSFSLTEPETTFPVLADTAWPMLQGDVRHSGVSIYDGTAVGAATGTPTSSPKWTVDLGSGSPSSPVIGLNREIYIGASGGNLYKVSFENATGTAELFYSAPSGGTIQTPAIASDGTIYISDNYHYLYALSADGALKWKYNIHDGSSPTIGSDGTIYVGSKYGLYALNPNGELVWQNPDLSNGRWVKAPVLDPNGNVYTVGKIDSDYGNRNVYALNPQDGSIIWKSASSTFDTAPALDDNGTIFVGGIYGLYALNTSSSSQKWLAKTDNDINGSIPAIGFDGTVYVGSYDRCLHAVNSGGTEKWDYGIFNTQGKISASPIIDKEGTIYIGSNSKTFYAVNPDGSLKWQSEELNDVISQGAAIDSTGTIYIASDDGTLYAFGE